MDRNFILVFGGILPLDAQIVSISYRLYGCRYFHETQYTNTSNCVRSDIETVEGIFTKFGICIFDGAMFFVNVFHGNHAHFITLKLAKLFHETSYHCKTPSHNMERTCFQSLLLC